MAQRTNYLQIFLQVYPGVRILLGFRVGMNKPYRATVYTARLGGCSLLYSKHQLIHITKKHLLLSR